MEKSKSIYRCINLLSVVICLATIILPILYWKQIPNEIPTHFNVLGEPDAYGDKTSLILVYFGEILTFGSLLFADVLIKMTAKSQNVSEAEKLSIKIICPMLSVLNLVLVIMFAYIIYCSASCIPMGKGFLIITLLATFFPIVFYLGKYIKASGTLNKKDETIWKEKEKQSNPKVYRSKIDVWLGILLFGSIALPIWLLIDDISKDGHISIVLLLTDVLLVILVLPLCFIKYCLYEEHLTVRCGIYGTVIIPYKSITNMKKTMNPLSSAALSMKRIQIDYIKNGAQGMILISPKDRDNFIAEIEKRK